MDFLKSTAKRELFFSGLYLLLGIFFVVRPGVTLTTIGIIFSIVMLIVGIINICSYLSEKNFIGIQKNGLAYGLILCILAIYFLIRPDFMAGLIGFIIGFMIIIAGITQLQNAVDLLHFKNKNWIFMLVSAVILIILGIIALVNPFETEVMLIRTTGIFIVISAVIKLISMLMLLFGARTVKKAENGEIIDADETDVKETDDSAATDVKDEKEEKKEDDKKDDEPVFNEDI